MGKDIPENTPTKTTHYYITLLSPTCLLRVQFLLCKVITSFFEIFIPAVDSDVSSHLFSSL